MGIQDYISSVSDSVKQNAPNLSSVKHLYGSSYDYSRAAITKIHNIFTDKSVTEKLNQHWPDEDTRSKIAKNLAVAAVEESVKFVPGGSSVYNIVYRSLSHDKKPRNHKDELQELKDKVGRLEKELSEHRKLLVQTQVHRPVMELDCNNTLSLSRKPEDMIRVFMMTEFVSRHLRDNLIVPGVGPGKPNTKHDQ